VRTVAVGALGHVVLDERSGRAFVLDHQTNTVRVLDVGGAPRRLAVDERTGRVFLVRHDERGHTLLVLDARDGAVRRHLRLDRTLDPPTWPSTRGRDARSSSTPWRRR
jgi:DNA-binding beta-propeller fold protein YncE